VERWIQQAITSSTKPSSNEAAGFAEGCSAVLMSMCSRLGFAVTPMTVTNGSRLQDVLREAAAIGTALEYTMAATFGTGPSKTERIDYLEKWWDRYCGYYVGSHWMPGYIEIEVRGNLSSFTTDYIQSGDTLPPDTSDPPTDAGILVAVTDLY
jgi:hypothetical protein